MVEIWALIAVFVIWGIVDLVLKIIFIRRGKDRIVLMPGDGDDWGGIGVREPVDGAGKKGEKGRKLSPENGQYQ